MGVDWLGPLVALAFLIGMAASAVLVRLGKVRRMPQIMLALALPFGCAVLPITILVLASLGWGAIGAFLR